MKYSLSEKFWRDGEGKPAVWQRPNLLLWAWIVATIGSKLITSVKLHEFLGVIGFGSIFAWAYLEITQGASYFRRLLGAIVLVWTILTRLRQ